ncbi:hypothetical protein GWK41_00925 [Persephonella atlantica]|uniref:Type II secretion system protein GspC N-terminal domain-containing protein n=1 Tax=Persephonella atlantica TaxID=2699429 RepID=A0ABS1GFC4_9AQUI|nr:hypothetical protein [Persephonella atlantica]MBK3331624.1 hypothetical protein [Persephonella atlantica]
MKKFKILGNREIAYLSFPIALGVLFYFLTADFVKSLIVKSWKLPDYHQTKPVYLFSEFYKEGLKLSEIKDIITVKPYEITVKTKTVQEEEKPPRYLISFIYIGKSRYVIINGKLLKEGENVSKDEKIVKIYTDGVLLKGKWGERWIRFLR